MALVFAALGTNYNQQAIGTLMSVWDSKASITRLTKGAGQVTIERPALTILAGGKTVWFQNEFRPERIGGVGGGWFSRWMFVKEDKDKGYRSSFATTRSGRGAAVPILRESLVKHLRSLQSVHEGPVPLTPEAIDLFDLWAEDKDERYDDESDPAEFTKRAEANVLKLALGLQACGGVDALDVISEKNTKRAIVLWQEAFESGRELVDIIQSSTTESRSTKELETVRRAVQRLRGGRIQRSELLRSSNLSKFQFDNAIETLIDTGELSIEEQPREEGQMGRTPVVYVALEKSGTS